MHISLLFKQIKADLIGKDSHRGVTLSYTWLSNQHGHFSLGFIPSFMIFTILHKFYDNTITSFRIAVYVSVFWLLFELSNFLIPLLFKKSKEKNSLISCSNVMGKSIFKPRWFNLAFDTFTDLNFFWLGAFSFSLFVKPPPIAIFLVVLLMLLTFFETNYWYVTKIYQSLGKYPFQIRLSQWNCNIKKEDKEKIKVFMNKQEDKNHLFIYGSHRAGKSELAVAISNELAIKHKKCTYITAAKLFSKLMDVKEIPKPDEKWNWLNADYLVIDDINPGGAVKTIVDANIFLQIIDGYLSSPNAENRSFFTNKSIIWVLGRFDTHKDVRTSVETWVNMLTSIGVKKEKIYSIVLEE